MNEVRDRNNKISPIKDNALLEENEAKYSLLVDSIKDYAICMLDPGGYIITWNSGAEKLKGYTKAETINKHFSLFYTEEARERKHPENELKIAKEKGRFEEEGWRVRKDGTKFWANVVITPIYNEKKQHLGFTKITRDLTEQKNLEDNLIKANEALKESEERSRLLIAGVKDYAIFLLTPEGKIATWNEGAKRIKGYEAQDVIGKHFSVFYTPEATSNQYPQFELAKALEDGRFEDEGWRVKKDGTKFWANVIITPIYNAKKQHIGFTKITRDLSERIKNEEIMKKNRELHKVNTDLDNFIYTVSHDLKSPISNLEGLVSHMETQISPKLDDMEKQILEMLKTSILKLDSTIGSLIEITKAQKNTEDKAEIVSFKEVLEDVKEEMSSIIAYSKAKIKEDLNVEELKFGKAYLKSIIYNLLSNAIKYRSPERVPEIQISTYREGNKTILSIKDNGLGLTKDQEVKIFSMFKRFHSHVGGTGLGLYIIKRTIENNGGEIEVHSQLNEGTEFKIHFNH